ncbi:hypothetical protein [Blastopirellula marina]|uniref:Uncharacterized protein n=1 Tax=Blastopirellula marina TaxID=124 RepID=A0A2S8GN74_9BACT|nr:hypothetical protein [Blastopirellula marina]PQO45875.1 hypothetical protein C5Y93_11495 [Blastopirellula marina]
MNQPDTTEAAAGKQRRTRRFVIPFFLAAAATTLAVGGYLGYRVMTIFPPSEIGVIGIETTPTERIVHFDQQANTMYWCDDVSTWPGKRSIVTLHRRWWSSGGDSAESKFVDRFAVPLDCEQVVLVGALGDGYLLEIADYPELEIEPENPLP